MDKKFGIYLHWPFCQAKCPYCDFNSHVFNKIDFKAWEKAFCDEILFYAETYPEILDKKLTSIFWGGGTPSLMPPELVAKVFETIDRFWPLAPDIEITMEANPTSWEAEKFAAFHKNGVNRLSIGVQSFDEKELKFLGRLHDAGQARNAILEAKDIFDRYSFDLIYALPNQNLNDWITRLHDALKIAGTHLSLYQLTIEPDTAFYHQHARGDFVMPDEDLSAHFYEATNDVMAAHGFEAYEVSNYAKRGAECRHNLLYWQYDDYLGVGPGAHGRLTLGDGKKEKQKFATYNIRAPELWLKAVETKKEGRKDFLSLTRAEQIEEFFLMGLRLDGGVTIQNFEQKFHANLFDFLDPQALQILAKEEKIFFDQTHLRVTKKGRLILNALLPFLLKDFSNKVVPQNLTGPI